MLKQILIILNSAFLILAPAVVLADSAPPSKNVTLNFTQNGLGVSDPIDFTINCFGQKMNKMTGELSEMQEISSLTDTCAGPGCTFGTRNIFEVYAAQLDHCDLAGTVNGQDFTVENVVAPDKKLNCQRAGYDMYDGRYWQETPEYNRCMDDVNNEYYPDGENFICHNSLEAVPQGECGGYGYLTSDGQCYRFTDATYQCIDEKDAKEASCREKMNDVTDQLALDDEGFAYDETCSIAVSLPTDLNLSTRQWVQTDPIPEMTRPSWFDRVWLSISCFFARLFGGRC